MKDPNLAPSVATVLASARFEVEGFSRQDSQWSGWIVFKSAPVPRPFNLAFEVFQVLPSGQEQKIGWFRLFKDNSVSASTVKIRSLPADEHQPLHVILRPSQSLAEEENYDDIWGEAIELDLPVQRPIIPRFIEE